MLTWKTSSFFENQQAESQAAFGYMLGEISEKG